jgi:hypothetical protein
MSLFPRTCSSTQPWFPPATQQIRVRSVKAVFIKGKLQETKTQSRVSSLRIVISVDDLLRDLDVKEGLIEMIWRKKWEKGEEDDTDDDVIWQSAKSKMHY